jgi:hypothetical protein
MPARWTILTPKNVGTNADVAGKNACSTLTAPGSRRVCGKAAPCYNFVLFPAC